jgi:hypothetical protein
MHDETISTTPPYEAPTIIEEGPIEDAPLPRKMHDGRVWFDRSKPGAPGPRPS